MCLTDLEEARGSKSSKHPQSRSPAEAFKKNAFPCFFWLLGALSSLAFGVTLFLLPVSLVISK